MALCSGALPEGCELVALNFELPSDGSVPGEIELLQAGEAIVGRDGRDWLNDNPQAVIDALQANGVDLVIDFDHATELKAPNGDEAPAAGWVPVNKLQLRDDGSIWGPTEWTPRGKAAVANRDYRYLSPVLVFEKVSRRIRSLSSIGLVNKPNLLNTALNFQQPTIEEVPTMLKKILVKLGLTETATEEQALNALGTLQSNLQTALNRAETPSLEKFVPRADYDQALTRANNVEQKLKERDQADLEAALNTEIDAALAAGKIVPATKDFYVAMCRQEGGLDQFKKFAAAAPVVGGASGLDGKKTPEHQMALNAEQEKIAGMFGNSADDLKKYGQA